MIISFYKGFLFCVIDKIAFVVGIILKWRPEGKISA